MKNKLSIIAALFALILVGCAKEAPQKDVEPKTVIVSVTMEEDTRVSLTPNTDTPHGLELKWEITDKLLLCFEYQDALGDTYYVHNEAPIIPGTISANGKTAHFTITIPTEIPAYAQFDLYGIYQKNDEALGGQFQANTKKYILKKMSLNVSRLI